MSIIATNKEPRFGCVLAEFWGSSEHQKNILNFRRYEIGFTDTSKIYHYTDLRGLHGIIEQSGFWLNHIRYMNDSEEFQHGRNLAINFLTRIAKKRSHSFFYDIIQGVISKLKSNDIPNYYIASFSCQGDSLDQWRGYCRDGGVSIELQHHHQPPFTLLPVTVLTDVLYDDATKIKIMLLAIKRFEFEYKLDQ